MNHLRPTKFEQLIGQAQVIENLRCSVLSAKKRRDCLNHTLFYGPPGLGKTTLANALANELGVPIQVSNGANLQTSRDLLPYLTSIEPNSILFIDEIHRMKTKVEEFLYPVMEDFRLDLVIPATKKEMGETITINIPKFCLVGATTEMGMLSPPFSDRFKLKHFLELYSEEELSSLISINADKLKIKISEEAVGSLAKVSRGTPRVANSFLEWARDYQIAYDVPVLSKEYIKKAIEMQGVDENGFNPIDRKYLEIMDKSFDGGPVGVSTLCAALNLDRLTVEETIEPWLLRQGKIAKTSRGRVLIQ